MNPLKKSKRHIKRKVAKATGIPTTKSGRKRKVARVTGVSMGGSNSSKKAASKSPLFIVLVILIVLAFIGSRA